MFCFVFVVPAVCDGQAASPHDDLLGGTFFERMEKLELTKSSGPTQTLRVGGIVRDTVGKRAADIWVVLQTHNTRDFITEFSQVDRRSKASHVSPNAFARTKTDSFGRFYFDDVAIPLHVDFFEVVAADESGRVGWTNGRCVPDFDHARFDINLVPVTDVRGRFVSSDGEPIADAVVKLSVLEHAGHGSPIHNGIVQTSSRSSGSKRPRPVVTSSGRWMSLRGSALQPTVRTDANGGFQIRGLPAGCVGRLLLTDGEFFRTQFVNTATNVTLESYKRPGREMPSRYSQKIHACDQPLRIVQTRFDRAEVVATDSAGDPIKSARIRLFPNAGYATTDADGKFEWIVSREWRETFSPEVVKLKQEGLVDGWMPTKQEFPVDQFYNAGPVKVRFEQDPRVTVFGIVQNKSTQQPIASMPVEFAVFSEGRRQPKRFRVFTDSLGAYRFKVPSGQCRVQVAGSRPGYRIPKQAFRALSDQDRSDLLRALDVANENLELKPILVEPIGDLEILVTDDVGSPVPNASIESAFREQTRGNQQHVIMPNYVPHLPAQKRSVDGLSKSDATGLCRLKMSSDSWVSGRLFVSAVIGGRKWYGDVVLSGPETRPIVVKLEKAWVLQGKVNANGIPAPDVEMVLSKMRSASPQQGMMSLPEPHYRLAKTGANGEYRFEVPPNQKYAVYVNHVPAEYRLLRPDLLRQDYSPSNVAANDYRFEDVELDTEVTWPIN
ncbi:hypothetical protein [Planctomycetes bacterium K23_9]